MGSAVFRYSVKMKNLECFTSVQLLRPVPINLETI